MPRPVRAPSGGHGGARADAQALRGSGSLAREHARRARSYCTRIARAAQTLPDGAQVLRREDFHHARLVRPRGKHARDGVISRRACAGGGRSHARVARCSSHAPGACARAFSATGRLSARGVPSRGHARGATAGAGSGTTHAGAIARAGAPPHRVGARGNAGHVVGEQGRARLARAVRGRVQGGGRHARAGAVRPVVRAGADHSFAGRSAGVTIAPRDKPRALRNPDAQAAIVIRPRCRCMP